MDGGGGEAEVDEHPPPVYSAGLRGGGRVGGVPLPHPAEGFLRPKRRSEGGAAGAGLQQVLSIRRQD